MTDPQNREKTLPEEAEAKIEMLTEAPIGVGTKFRLTTLLSGRKLSTETEFIVFEKNRRTVERQTKGDLKKWEVESIFEVTNKGTKITTTFDYELPYSILGKIIDKLGTGKQIKEFATMASERSKQYLEETYLVH
ncbi:MAG: hypothetical protein ACFFD7_12355 [Candidatus Thorarchaeota archaeon]